MEYRSPLGGNFKLQTSLAALEKSVSETPRKPGADFIPFQQTNTPRQNNSGNQQWANKGNGRNSQFEGNPGFNNRQSHNWRSPNQGNYHKSKSISISEYYHPSMVEDPWKDLIEKT